MADSSGVREIEIIVTGSEEGPLSPGSGAVIFLPSGDIRILLPGGLDEDSDKRDQPGSLATMIFAVMRAGLSGDKGPLGQAFLHMVDAFEADFRTVTGQDPHRVTIVDSGGKMVN